MDAVLLPDCPMPIARRLRLALPLALAAFLPAACGDFASRASQPAIPVTQWDHRPEAEDWSRATIAAIANGGNALVETPLDDVAAFCPGYDSATESERKKFWVALFSGLAKYESTWNPRAAGAGGRYRGLLQILPQTARWRGCEMTDASELYDGATNLACAVRIASAAVERDGVVAGGPGAWGGVAADWPPLRDAAKRAEIAAFTRAQPYCRG